MKITLSYWRSVFSLAEQHSLKLTFLCHSLYWTFCLRWSTPLSSFPCYPWKGPMASGFLWSTTLQVGVSPFSSHLISCVMCRVSLKRMLAVAKQEKYCIIVSWNAFGVDRRTRSMTRNLHPSPSQIHGSSLHQTWKHKLNLFELGDTSISLTKSKCLLHLI